MAEKWYTQRGKVIKPVRAEIRQCHYCKKKTLQHAGTSAIMIDNTKRIYRTYKCTECGHTIYFS